MSNSCTALFVLLIVTCFAVAKMRIPVMPPALRIRIRAFRPYRGGFKAVACEIVEIFIELCIGDIQGRSAHGARLQFSGGLRWAENAFLFCQYSCR